MWYQLASELVLALHLGIALFAVLGGLGVAWRPRWAWAHLPVAAWCTFVNLTDRVCPLTPLENAFRAAAGQQGYEGAFIEHYVVPVLYPAGMTLDVALTAGIALPTWTALVYTWAWRRHRRADRATPAGAPRRRGAAPGTR